MTFIITASGKAVDFLNPKIESIDIHDIAHSLAITPRYVGHTDWLEFGLGYSVGQHSIHVATLIQKAGGEPYEQLWGLMHDASEAYTGDCNSPLKQLLPGFKDIEVRLTGIICDAFGMERERPDIVKWADQRAYLIETRDLRPIIELYPVVKAEIASERTISPWSPHYVRLMFLRTFSDLRSRSLN